MPFIFAQPGGAVWVKIRMSSIMHKTITPSVDSPALRHASGELLSLALMDARNHTLYLMSQYEQALGTKQFQVPFVRAQPTVVGAGAHRLVSGMVDCPQHAAPSWCRV